MFPLLVNSLLSAPDFPTQHSQMPSSIFIQANSTTPTSQFGIRHHRPQPPAPEPTAPALVSAAGGLLGHILSSASRSSSLQALGLGRGKSKPAWLLPIFPLLT